jgi:hypothetical protein
MRLPGYCYKCRRVRTVRVEIPPGQGGVAIGICQECEDKRTDRPPGRSRRVRPAT